jgi:hypothetical protein
MENTSLHLARIDDLTRRYARYSRHQAGLGAVWGGVCLTLLGGLILAVDLLRYAHRAAADHAIGFWRFLVTEPNRAQQPWLLLTALALPALWLLGRTWIQRRVYERDGTVVGQDTPKETTARLFFTVVEIAYPCVLMPLKWIPVALQDFPAALLPGTLLASVVAFAVPLVGRRLPSGLDRSASLLLFIGSGAVLAGGGAESLLVFMLAYAILGLFLAGQGLRSHREFLRVKRELDSLSPPDSGSDIVAPAPDQPAGFLPR